jgi:hypothetical protein
MITPSGPETVNHKGLTAFPADPSGALQGPDNARISVKVNVISGLKFFFGPGDYPI